MAVVSFLLRARRTATFSMLALLCASTSALAGPVTIPHTFQSNTPAVAAEVNDNFAAVETAVDDNDSRLAALESALASLQGVVSAQQATIDGQAATIAALQSDLAAVQGSAVMALEPHLVLLNVPDPANPSILYPTVQFSGVNLQVVNGLAQTGTTNGLGNLIVGYNESAGLVAFCSDGAYNSDQTNCEDHGGIWAANQRSGSHNVVLGNRNAYSQYGGLVAGSRNIINRGYASVSGGGYNTASGNFSSVSGGIHNTASAEYTSVCAGTYGTASGDSSSVSGGIGNTASGAYSSVSGGRSNTASGGSSTVSGGFEHSAPSIYNWAAGDLFEND